MNSNPKKSDVPAWHLHPIVFEILVEHKSFKDKIEIAAKQLVHWEFVKNIIDQFPDIEITWQVSDIVSNTNGLTVVFSPSIFSKIRSDSENFKLLQILDSKKIIITMIWSEIRSRKVRINNQIKIAEREHWKLEADFNERERKSLSAVFKWRKQIEKLKKYQSNPNNIELLTEVLIILNTKLRNYDVILKSLKQTVFVENDKDKLDTWKVAAPIKKIKSLTIYWIAFVVWLWIWALGLYLLHNKDTDEYAIDSLADMKKLGFENYYNIILFILDLH